MPTRDPAFTDQLHRPSGPISDAEEDEPRPPRRDLGSRRPLVLALLGALVGALFSAVSTSDFMQHLDRQVHAIHCSFIPGAAKEIAESGCRTVMMSPYSSFFRDALWGGIPISLWALAVFAFLSYRLGLVAWRGRTSSSETKVLLLAAGLPVAMSVAYGALSVLKLDALCKVCIGIYAASAACFVGVLLVHLAEARRYSPAEARLVPVLVEGAGLVAALTLAYVVLAPRPDSKASMLGCGTLVRAEDTAGIMIPLTATAGGAPSIEVLDPLCPSCKAFDARLAASSLGERLDLKAVLFPLDSACNWMVTETIHPGACTVSEAVLCAAGLEPGRKDTDAAGAVLRWAFAHQAELRAAAARDDRALRIRIEREFPGVRGCLGGALVKSKLTKSLRWAVANAIPVLTPQLFVHDSRMCDEDTDLGLEYTLTRMLSPEAERERARRRPAVQPAPQPRADGGLQAGAAAALEPLTQPAAMTATRKPEPPAPSAGPAAELPRPEPARVRAPVEIRARAPDPAPAEDDAPPLPSEPSDEETKR